MRPAESIARTVTSVISSRTTCLSALQAKVFAVMRSTRKTPRHSGRKAKKWSENRSNSLDERPEEISSTLRKALAMQDPVIVGAPVDYRDNSQNIRDTYGDTQ